MRKRCLRAIENAGVSPAAAQQLAELVANPPPGTFDVSELENADDTSLCLLSGIVAATRHWEFGEASRRLLEAVSAHADQLSAYDRARFWHLKGISAWRLDGSVYAASHAFQRSISWIQQSETAEANTYLPRVLDALGQVLHHQGQLQDARFEFELAAKYREALDDEPGLALTLGNLGRLCLDFGDFAAAQSHLGRDLEIVERISPEMTRLRTQLLSHLGTCALELGQFDQAQQCFDKSEALAQADGNTVGMIYVALGRARIALHEQNLDHARTLSESALAQLNDPAIPASLQVGLSALALHTCAEVYLARGDIHESVEKFAAAREKFALEINASPVEVAAMLNGYATAMQALGDTERATQLYRAALQHLDSTAAENLRSGIEHELQANFRDSWLLHAAGRFIGQQQIEFLLNEAGRAGFRGAKKEVAILFSDIRGFTTISEHFSPEALIVFLNDFLSCMTRCVGYCDGFVDKFIGDALMALFGLPEAKSQDAENSMMAALMMQSELVRFNRKMPTGTPSLQIGIGIHFGSTVAGLIGSPQKRSYTVIGDAVNTASRLEGMTKQLGASILVSEDVVRRVEDPDRFLLRLLGRYCPKGRAQAVAIYDLMGERATSEFGHDVREEIEQATAAWQMFEQRDFRRAGSDYERLAQAAEGTPRQVGYHLLAAKSHEYGQNPPDEDWNGAVTLTSK